MQQTVAAIDANQLLTEFMSHIATCPAKVFVLNQVAAFESWFQVELAHVLLQSGYGELNTNYAYPDTKQKADLQVLAKLGSVVFELKCFVAHQDANKIYTFPQQLQRLKQLFLAKQACQGIAIATFIGYSDEVTHKRFNKLFPETEWEFRSLRKFEGHRLWVGIASTCSASNNVKALS